MVYFFGVIPLIIGALAVFKILRVIRERALRKGREQIIWHSRHLPHLDPASLPVREVALLCGGATRVAANDLRPTPATP